MARLSVRPTIKGLLHKISNVRLMPRVAVVTDMETALNWLVSAAKARTLVQDHWLRSVASRAKKLPALAQKISNPIE